MSVFGMSIDDILNLTTGQYQLYTTEAAEIAKSSGPSVMEGGKTFGRH